jgi:uncharacterized protein YegL
MKKSLPIKKESQIPQKKSKKIESPELEVAKENSGSSEEEVKLPAPKKVSKPQKVQKNIPNPQKVLSKPTAKPIQAKLTNVRQMMNHSPINEPVQEEPLPLNEEEFEVKQVETVTTAGPADINVNFKIAVKPVALSPLRAQEIPCLVEISSPEQQSAARSGIDIICVIDVSGSMQGQKLELVKKTLLFMIKRLSVTDRVSLITFSDDAKRKSGLVTMNETGKEKLSKIITSMHIEGGTEILKGLESSFSLIQSRKVPNQITSVILLSDGVDNNVDSAMTRLNALFTKYRPKITTGFVIHTFGYGSDHQADLMNSMASTTNGGFYFVEQEKTIPQAFSDCLGEMMSVVADSVQVELITLPAGIPFSLTKVYSETGDLSFRMPPILAGDKKEAVFLVNFLPADLIVAPQHFENIVKGKIQFKLTATGEVRTVEAFLTVQVVNESENNEVELDEEVMVNFYRVKCADVLKEAANLGDNGRLKEARDLLTAAVQEFRACIVASHPTVIVFIQDLEGSIPRFADRQVYEYGGKASMKSKFNSHQNKRGIYKNKMQCKLLEEAEEEFS